jgi:hypothetical protein
MAVYGEIFIAAVRPTGTLEREKDPHNGFTQPLWGP